MHTVRLPLKHLYLVALLLILTYLIFREISHYGRRRLENRCEGLEQVTTPLQPARRNQPNEAVMERGAGQCSERPRQTMVCPLCFRPHAYILSKRLQPIPDSNLRFPRGPPKLFQPRSRRQQVFMENYLITPWAVCSPSWQCPYLLAVQLSVASDSTRRNAVRSTWGSVAKTQTWPHANINSRVQILFVLAHPQLSKPASPTSNLSEGAHQKKQWNLLQDEAVLHGDLLYIDMLDSYFNLTLKLLSAFKWVRYHCPTVKFILKVDTDTFVNVPLLLDLLILNENRLQYSVTGNMYTRERSVHRQGVWAVNHSQYPPPIYPVYASGCSYIVSVSALDQMVEILPYMVMDHLSTFLGPDYFITGVMGIPLALDYFDVIGKELFGACNSTQWRECDLISDNRVFAKLDHSTANTAQLSAIWAAFFKFYGHYQYL